METIVSLPEKSQMSCSKTVTTGESWTPHKHTHFQEALVLPSMSRMILMMKLWNHHQLRGIMHGWLLIMQLCLIGYVDLIKFELMRCFVIYLCCKFLRLLLNVHYINILLLHLFTFFKDLWLTHLTSHIHVCSLVVLVPVCYGHFCESAWDQCNKHVDMSCHVCVCMQIMSRESQHRLWLWVESTKVTTRRVLFFSIDLGENMRFTPLRSSDR